MSLIFASRGDTFLRSAFFVGSGTRKDRHFNKEDANFLDTFFLKSLFSRCGETNSQVPQVPQGCLSFGHGSSAGCEDDFEGHKGWAFSGTSGAGRSETEFEGSLHDLPNSLWQWVQPMLLGTWALLVHVVSTISTVMWLNSRICSWRPLLNWGMFCIVLIQRIRSSVIHPCTRPSLARVIDGTGGGVCEMISGVGHCTVGWFVARCTSSFSCMW